MVCYGIQRPEPTLYGTSFIPGILVVIVKLNIRQEGNLLMFSKWAVNCRQTHLYIFIQAVCFGHFGPSSGLVFMQELRNLL